MQNTWFPFEKLDKKKTTIEKKKKKKRKMLQNVRYKRVLRKKFLPEHAKD